MSRSNTRNSKKVNLSVYLSGASASPGHVGAGDHINHCSVNSNLSVGGVDFA